MALLKKFWAERLAQNETKVYEAKEVTSFVKSAIRNVSFNRDRILVVGGEILSVLVGPEVPDGDEELVLMLQEALRNQDSWGSSTPMNQEVRFRASISCEAAESKAQRLREAVERRGGFTTPDQNHGWRIYLVDNQ